MTGTRRDLDGMARLGWAETATPVLAEPDLAAQWRLGWLGIKCDELTAPLFGGSKVRKLDFLLASPDFAEARHWATVGAIGSGHAVATAAAAELRGRQLHAALFWEPPSYGVQENLAYVASYAHRLSFYRGRVALALTAPQVLLGRRWQGAAVVPPGGSSPRGTLGMVRAGLELAEQIRDGELPVPERVYVALGSGGTAVGLAIGLGLAQVPCELRAVYTVEQPLSSRRRLLALQQATLVLLARHGIAGPPPRPLVLVGGHLGRGYGHPTAESQVMRQSLVERGFAADDVYTGKALAAMQAEAMARPAGPPPAWLFWNTVRRSGALPSTAKWQDRLPIWLQHRLGPAAPAAGWSRRAVLASAATLVAARALSADRVSDWQGHTLGASAAATLAAAAEALIEPPPAEATLAALTLAVDRYVTGLPVAMRREILALFAAIEHGLPGLLPFSRASRRDRLARLLRLRDLGGPLMDLWNGIRDLTMLGLWQQPELWPELGYPGPMMPAGPRPRRPSYDRLAAPSGAEPPGLERW
ncbi:MAG: pyridoxal-phosphate dependent enzyme [Deltaproteobacteria bacterium]|nr:pyridoxal-phosphate dependent enzyme [Deltaproteobacteria bacterium]